MDVPLKLDGNQYSLTIRKELLDDNRVAIGVFVDVPGLLGSSIAVHDGFLLTVDGSRESMPMDLQVKNI